MTTVARRILPFAGFVSKTSSFLVQYCGLLFGEAVWRARRPARAGQ